MCCIRARAAPNSTCMCLLTHDTVSKDWDSPVQNLVNLKHVLAKHRWFMSISLVLTAILI